MLLQLWLNVRWLAVLRPTYCRLGRLVRLTHRLAPWSLSLFHGFHELEVSLREIDGIVYRARAAELYGQAQTFQAQLITLHKAALLVAAPRQPHDRGPGDAFPSTGYFLQSNR